MGPELQGAIVGGLIGLVAALLGAAFGVGVERFLRRRGKLLTRIAWVQPSMHGKIRDEHITSTQEQGKTFLVADEVQLDQMYDFDLSYNFRIALFNEKDVDTGLSNISGAIIGPDGRDFAPLRGAVRGGDNTLNLPSRKWVSFNLVSDNFGGDHLEPAKNTHQLQVRGTFPDGQPYKSPKLRYEVKDYLGEITHYSV